VGCTEAEQGGIVKRAKERRIKSAELEHRGEGDAFRVSYMKDRECVMERDAEREGRSRGGGGEGYLLS